MPMLHDSVTYCETCDLYVAAMETSSCEECGKKICPGCAKSTNDPNLLVCSYRCRAIFNQSLSPILPEAA